MQLAFISIFLYACNKWYVMEKDFIRFLSDIKYSNHTANVYLWKLKKFADKNGYKNLVELADDVFILLDQGRHGDRKFDTDTLSEIKRYENVLILFNSFLFDIGFKRQFVVPSPSSANYMQVLTTHQEFKENVCPRTLIDKDDKGNITSKQFFNVSDVTKALHIQKEVLERWQNNLSSEEKKTKCIPNRYKGIPDEIKDNPEEQNKYNPHFFSYYYYKLKELNDFLEYQFDYGTDQLRLKYMRSW